MRKILDNCEAISDNSKPSQPLCLSASPPPLGTKDLTATHARTQFLNNYPYTYVLTQSPGKQGQNDLLPHLI